MPDNNDKGFSTKAVHSGESRDNEHHSITTPIHQSATFTFETTQDVYDFFQGKSERVAEYGRYGNPTQRVAENKLKELENAEEALLFSSGMAAITTAVFAFCRSGDHVVLTADSYRRTRQFIRQIIPKFGIEYSIVEPQTSEIEKGIKKNTKLIISELPTNPYLRVLDLEGLVAVAKKHKVKTLIDSTLATPLNLRPLDYGVDMVIHSVTKYLSGHNDILAGVLLGKAPLINAIKELQGVLGNITDPNTSFMMLRGLKSFAIRVRQQNKSAMKIAQFLESHKKIEKVWYPGLESHPDHAVAKNLMDGFGGLISFQIVGGIDEGSRLIDSLKIPLIAPSLGGVDSLIEQPSLMSYFELSSEERNAAGIYDNLIRFSTGIEDVDDLIADFKQGLEFI